MSRQEHKDTITNAKDKISPPEPSSLTTVGPEKYSTAEAHGKDFKIAIMSLFRDLKENVSISINEVSENTN